MGGDQILSYLKSKYLSKPVTTAPKTNDSKEGSTDIPVGEESEYSGEEAENKFLLTKLTNVQGELTKWLDVLKLKINKNHD